MDPLEDAYDRLLRDEIVSDELLSAAQALEEAAMLSPSAPVQVADADEYDLMFTEDVSEEVLLAWDEAGREVPAKSGVGATHPRKLDATHPSGPVTKYEEPSSWHPVSLNTMRHPRLTTLSSPISTRESRHAPPSSSPPCAPIRNSSIIQNKSPRPAFPNGIRRQVSALSSPAPPSSESQPHGDSMAPSSSALSTPMRNINSQVQVSHTKPKKIVILGSPISISSDSSSDYDSSDDEWPSRDHPTPNTSPVIVETRRPSAPRPSCYKSWEFMRTKSVTSSSTNELAPVRQASNHSSLKRKSAWEDEPGTAKKRRTSNHLADFFADYPDFDYDPAAPVSAQYRAMCALYGLTRPKWGLHAVKSDPATAAQRNAAYNGYKKAMARTFAEIYGTDVNNLDSWQSLCRVLELDPIPQTLWGCRAAVREVHVNLVDLVDWGATGDPVHKFDTEAELAGYTRITEKFFPQDEAESSGLLVYLLRHIL